jgi:hypothetical protein
VHRRGQPRVDRASEVPPPSSASAARRSSAAFVSGHPRTARESHGGTPIAGRGSEGFPPDPNGHPSGSTFLPSVVPGAPTYLAPGSDPGVLPGPVLIADKLNNRLLIVDPQGHIRWTWPQPGDLAPGQTFVVPDDAFFSPDGRYIIATQEDDFVITVIAVAAGDNPDGVDLLPPSLTLTGTSRRRPKMP